MSLTKIDVNTLNTKTIRLGIHYHIPVSISDGVIYCPHYFGVWIDSLSSYFCKIVLIVHVEKDEQSGYIIQADNIDVVDLGVKKRRFIGRLLNIPKTRRNLKKSLDEIDAILFRAPSFSTIYLYPLVKNKSPSMLLVGNMYKMALMSRDSWWKRAVNSVYWWLDKQALIVIGNRMNVFSNGPYLRSEYGNISNVNVIFTSTLLSSDIVATKKLMNNNEFRLTYTGRISPEKGLEFLIQALSIVGIKSIVLTVVGEKEGDEFHRLKMLSQQLGVQDNIRFSGYISDKKIMNDILDESDIFVMPSIWDGQPRAIWEAMARGLPVIASRGIASLPLQFTHKDDIYFVDPGDFVQLADAVRELQSDHELYKKLSKASLRIAKERTVGRSADLLLEGLKKSEKFRSF